MTEGHCTLILWDVDHTLIENGGVSKEIYAAAFADLVGRPAVEQPRTDGRTDMAIMENLISANGEDRSAFPQHEQWQALTEQGRRLQPALVERGHALPGAAALLQHLNDKEAWVIQSILTGNIENNARVKLGAFGLDQWIDFDSGGFGSESRVRADLVPVAQRKAASKHEFDPATDVTVLIGDTFLDVEAGLRGGARVIGVATGMNSVDELVAAGADAVVPDLTDLDAFMETLARVREMGPTGPRQPPSA